MPRVVLATLAMAVLLLGSFVVGRATGSTTIRPASVTRIVHVPDDNLACPRLGRAC